MTTIFRSVAADLTTVRVDFAYLNNNPSATAGFGVLAEVDLADIDIDNEFIKSTAPGADVAMSTENTVDRVYMMEAKSTTYPLLKTLFRTMQAEMRTGGILEWRPEGDSVSLFIKFHPSPIPSMFRGDDFANIAVLGSNYVRFPMIVRQQPYGYGTEETLASSVALTNTVGDMERIVTSTGTVSSPARIEAAIAASTADIVQMRLGIKSAATADLTAFASKYSFEVETATSLGSNTSSVAAVGTTSGDAYANTNYAATGYMNRRWRKEITPTAATNLAGSYNVIAICRLTAGTKQTLQLRWGLRDVDPVDKVREEVVLDAQNASGTPWVPVYLGHVNFPSEASFLVLEGWSRLDVGATNDDLDWDYVVMFPTDNKITLATIIGFGMGEPNKTLGTGDSLLTPTSPGTATAGAARETALVLNDNNEAGGTAPNAGTVFPAGKVIFTVRGSLRQSDTSARQTLGTLVARNVTAGSDAATRNLTTIKNREVNDFETQVTFDADGTSAYQPQVRFTKASPDTDDRIFVEEWRTSAIRTVQDGLKIVIDGSDPEQNGVYDGAVKVADIRVTGAIPTLQPGDNSIVAQVYGWSGGSYQDDVDERGPLPKVDFNRSFALTVKSKPLHPL